MTITFPHSMVHAVSKSDPTLVTAPFFLYNIVKTATHSWGWSIKYYIMSLSTFKMISNVSF